jgi:outer membrane protein insertion porin family
MVFDSIAVAGNRRVTTPTILGTSGLSPGRALTFRDVQRAVTSLYASGNFDDIRITQGEVAGKAVLKIDVVERPLLLRWTIRGVELLGERAVRERIQLVEGRPLDPAALTRSRALIDSLYRSRGFYLVKVEARRLFEDDSTRARVVFEVTEGRRVAVARVRLEGNEAFSDEEVVRHMKTRPEGFWFFRKGEYDEEKVAEDRQVNLPTFYGERGYADFHVMSDTLLVNDSTGKGEVVLVVREGDRYTVGSFEVAGNRRFSREQIDAFYPFRPVPGEPTVFNQARWNEATERLKTAYANEGYIYAQVRSDVVRRAGPDGPVVDLRWVLQEGQPAIVNRIEIAGNEITHERVVREMIVLLPGDVFRQDALIRSYQNISNLGFFEQPLPGPETVPNEQGDVNITFHVRERKTGTVNFGASVGQGTGLGGFLGLDEPNLFGQGKRGKLQWQFGKNINDFDITYSDPALFESRVSATLSLHSTRLRYTIADIGRVRSRGGTLQFGFPLLGARYTRVFASYSIDQQNNSGSISRGFFCDNCIQSSIGVSVLRDTRVDLPFATGGTLHSAGITTTGGVLGGTANFRKVDLEGRWYAPLGGSSSAAQAGGVRFVLGLSSRAGFVFGDAGPFFRSLFAMGGTQFSIPLRGYEHFAITPRGFDPNSGEFQANPDAFGKAFFVMTAEAGARLSQMVYINTFFDAGNVYATASRFNPTRLFRGAGVGVSLITPLGPLGLDLAYGFDKFDRFGRRAPGWKVHFRLGQFF